MQKKSEQNGGCLTVLLWIFIIIFILNILVYTSILLDNNLHIFNIPKEAGGAIEPNWFLIFSIILFIIHLRSIIMIIKQIKYGKFLFLIISLIKIILVAAISKSIINDIVVGLLLYGLAFIPIYYYDPSNM